jgi:hypothetical protein
MTETRRATLSKLAEAHIRLDARMKAAKGDMPELRRLITIRKGLRLMMEPLATATK